MPAIMARLVYLTDPPLLVRLTNVEDAFAQVSQFVAAACTALARWKGAAGHSCGSRINDLRLALPASPGYFRRKQRIREAAGRSRRSGMRDDAARRRYRSYARAHRARRDFACRGRRGDRQDVAAGGPRHVLLAQRVPPRNIAAITFTELAAGELRDRVSAFSRASERVVSLRSDGSPVRTALTGPRRRRSQRPRAAGRSDLHDHSRLLPHLLRSYAIEANDRSRRGNSRWRAD